ncbi:MAG: hypothetical protein JXR48_10110 [Candidatus Delongbacteria bacterium]|nr:hypothetical protein [Candidatus Delongbacteria bacterium]MBN2835308.1 hypothetical protein [Candidatus Delongbacteria bacterium]
MSSILNLEHALSILVDGTVNGRFHGKASDIATIFSKCEKNGENLVEAIEKLAQFISSHAKTK